MFVDDTCDSQPPHSSPGVVAVDLRLISPALCSRKWKCLTSAQLSVISAAFLTGESNFICSLRNSTLCQIRAITNILSSSPPRFGEEEVGGGRGGWKKIPNLHAECFFPPPLARFSDMMLGRGTWTGKFYKFIFISFRAVFSWTPSASWFIPWRSFNPRLDESEGERKRTTSAI